MSFDFAIAGIVVDSKYSSRNFHSLGLIYCNRLERIFRKCLMGRRRKDLVLIVGPFLEASRRSPCGTRPLIPALQG